MFVNTIHTWLDYKFEHWNYATHKHGKQAYKMLFFGYINGLYQQVENYEKRKQPKPNLTPDEHLQPRG